MNLALGCERLLKGILYDINPTYILNEPTFKNSVQVLYGKKLLPGSKGSPELAAKFNGDVITFRNSLLRAQLVSATTEQHKNILFAISEARDIIAHCELSQLNTEQIKGIIQRDFYTMLKSFAEELNIKPSMYFEHFGDRISKISIAHQTDLSIKVRMLLELHLEKWHVFKTNSDFILRQKKVTRQLLNQQNKGKTKCPACEQEAVVILQTVLEFSTPTMTVSVIGYEAKRLNCYFCKLKIEDPAILDHLGIKFIPPITSCRMCGYQYEESAQFCPSCGTQTVS
jgi:Zn finger protein HypA/HybF involved in hydrogenase expression